MSLGSRLNGFLFGSVSVLPLAMLRIATGVITLAWALLLFSDVDPLLTYLRSAPAGEILWWQPFPELSTAGVQLLCLLLIVAAGFLALGAWTATSAWLVFLLTLALQRYNPAAFNGGDLILRGVLQLGVALGPAGAGLSIDALRNPKKARALMEAWPLRFVQLHISIGYLLTAYLKMRGQSWLDGTAIWHALQLGELTRFRLPTWLIAPPLGSLLTWGTLLTEAFVGLGVWWRRSRPYALMTGVALHLGIALTLEISFFSVIMIASYLAFIPGYVYKSAGTRLRGLLHRPARLPQRSVIS
jgi:hypothetical protein